MLAEWKWKSKNIFSNLCELPEIKTPVHVNTGPLRSFQKGVIMGALVSNTVDGKAPEIILHLPLFLKS